MTGRHFDDNDNGVADYAEGHPYKNHDDSDVIPMGVVSEATPLLFGVDIHPRYQAGISIERVVSEGFSWVAVKVSQGTAPTDATTSDDWMARAEKAGALAVPYHYLTAGNEAAQAATAKTYARGRAIMLDVEAGSGTTANVWAFLNAAASIGLRVALLYLPNWYWNQLGAPSLAGMPQLVASHYVTGTGAASTLYQSIGSSWWSGYGGNTVSVLQFSDRATVAGLAIDVNAFRGARADLAALLSSGNESTTAESDVQNFPVPAGAGEMKLIVPVGGTSITADGWLSLSLAEGSGTAKVFWQQDSQGISEWDVTLTKDHRQFAAIPDGCTQFTVQWNVSGPLGIAVETKGK